MSDTPKKKPAKKAQPTKKAQPKKPAVSGNHPSNRRGRPPKKGAENVEVKQKYVANPVDTDSTSLVAEAIKPEAPQSVVIHANDVKKASLRKRMLKWFKK